MFCSVLTESTMQSILFYVAVDTRLQLNHITKIKEHGKMLPASDIPKCQAVQYCWQYCYNILIEFQ